MKSALEKPKLEQRRGSVEQQRLHGDQRHGDSPVVWIKNPRLNKKWNSKVSICASELSLMNTGFITSDILVLVKSKIQEVLTGCIYGGPEEQKPNLNPECVKTNNGTDGANRGRSSSHCTYSHGGALMVFFKGLIIISSTEQTDFLFLPQLLKLKRLCSTAGLFHYRCQQNKDY